MAKMKDDDIVTAINAALREATGFDEDIVTKEREKSASQYSSVLNGGRRSMSNTSIGIDVM